MQVKAVDQDDVVTRLLVEASATAIAAVDSYPEDQVLYFDFCCRYFRFSASVEGHSPCCQPSFNDHLLQLLHLL